MDYTSNELISLREFFLEYERHLDDINSVEDKRLKAVIFIGFENKYYKIIDKINVEYEVLYGQ